MDDLFAHYTQLLARLADFERKLRSRHAKDIHCGPGCAACCGQVLDLLPVEFHYLRAAAQAADLRRTAAAGTGCPLLSGGTCRLYDYRPVICRTHGMPLLIEAEGRRQADCCPENFQAGALAGLPGESLLDLERVNLLLVSINHVFAAAAGIAADERISIAELFRDMDKHA
jgi:Fe-S-cluster containining protein